MYSKDSKEYSIHPSADVQTSMIGEGSSVWQFCVILKKAQIGKNCNINCHVFIENDVIIGDNVTLKPGVQVWDGLRLEDGVFVGPNVTFTNDSSPRSKQDPFELKKTIIEKGASIGANATILAGITIGRFSLIGAGAVVTKNVPPFSLWYGNPAIHKGFVTKEGDILDMNMISRNSNRSYHFIEGDIVELT